MLHGIPATSLWGLRARAEEAARSGGLFQDPLAVSWYERLSFLSEGPLDSWFTPILQQAIALRTAILDEAVRRHCLQHPEPVVIELGAGFSTRFSRIQPSQGQWYELDLPELMELRLSLKEPPAPHHWVLAYSVFDPEWLQHLAELPASQILLIAEGLLMFFPRAEVQQLFQRLQEHFAGASIAFDVMGSLNLKSAQAFGVELQAPVYWGARDLRRLPAEFGLTPAGDLSLPAQIQLEPRYAQELSWLQRLILRQRWLTRRMGGTVLARL